MNPARWSGGALYAPPAGSAAEPQPKLNMVHFSKGAAQSPTSRAYSSLINTHVYGENTWSWCRR